MKKRMIIMLVVVGVVSAIIIGMKYFGHVMMKSYFSSMGNQPQTVSTTNATYQDWQEQIQAVATLRSENGVDLAVEVAGVVGSIEFNSGDDVLADKILLRLKADSEMAQLRAAEAKAELAEITWQRDEKQLKANAISQADFDNDTSVLKNAKAELALQQEVVNTHILRAPFAGRLGIREVDLGQYLSAGDVVVTLQNLDSIVADFWLPESYTGQIACGQNVTATIDSLQDVAFKGKIIAIEPKVREDSRNFRVRARLVNENHRLLPGMFARIVVYVGKSERYITVPQSSLSYNPYGTTVFLVKAKETSDGRNEVLEAQQVFVTTGPSRGDQIAVLKGINDGDSVVSAGQIKLRNGATVVIDNRIQPSNDANPSPRDQ